MESVQSKKYQYSVGLTTVANFFSARFGAAKVDDMLVQQKGDVFFKKEFALATVDGRSRRSCTRKLADSAEPGSE